MLDELGDPVLTSTYNRLRVEGYGRKILEMGDQRIIVSSEPVNILTGRDWVTLIVVPEADFVGFVANSGWAALGMSIIVVLIVAALAGLMTWRSVQAERRVSAAATRQQALEVRTQTFIGLARGAADERGLRRGEPTGHDGKCRRGVRRQAGGDLAPDIGSTRIAVRGLFRSHRRRSHVGARTASRRAAPSVRGAG